MPVIDNAIYNGGVRVATPVTLEETFEIRLEDPVALPDPERRELARADEPVDRHVRDAHHLGHLGHGEQPPRDARWRTGHQTPLLRVCLMCHMKHTSNIECS